MPYITAERRKALVPGVPAENCGELNYLFSTLVLESDDMRGLDKEMLALCHQYIAHNGLKYQHINDVIGALKGARLEMRRRTGSPKFNTLFDDVATLFYYDVAAPYEDTKIKENGDLPNPPPARMVRSILV